MADHEKRVVSPADVVAKSVNDGKIHLLLAVCTRLGTSNTRQSS